MFLAAIFAGGNCDEVIQLIPLLQTTPPNRGRRGWPLRRPKRTSADRSYDHDTYRRRNNIVDFPANSRPGVIPVGRTAIGDADAASLLGVSVTMFRRRRLYAVLPPTLSRPGVRIRLWDLDQVHACLSGQAVPALPIEEDPLDLLDSDAARGALPEGRRLAAETWRARLSAGAGPAPDQTFHTNNLPGTPTPSPACPGAPYRFRATVLAWDAQRQAFSVGRRSVTSKTAPARPPAGGPVRALQAGAPAVM